MSRISKADLEFCWGQVLDFDPWFRMHFVFAPRRNATQILALNALIAMIERALTLSEESLVVTQLAWWQNELSQDQSAGSAHPVVRVLRDSGALSCFAQEQLEGLVATALLRLHAEPFQTEADLRAMCERIGQGAKRLELALESHRPAHAEFEEHCAGTGLARLCASNLRDRHPRFWFMPLSIQARHQLKFPALDQNTAGGSAAFGTLRSLGEEWFEGENRALAQMVAQIGSAPSIRRHLLASGLTWQLGFTRAMGRCEAGQSGNSSRWGLRDFVRIWSNYRALLGAERRKNE